MSDSQHVTADAQQLFLQQMQAKMAQMEQHFNQQLTQAVQVSQQQQQTIARLEKELIECKSANSYTVLSPGNASQHSQHTPPSPLPLSPTFRLDITKPSIWHGSSKEDKSSAEMWLLEVENYFNAVNLSETAQNHAHRVSVVSTLLRGNALQWWNRVDRRAVATWQGFRTVFLSEYQPKEAAEMARARLDQLRQRRSVVEYCNEFRQEMNKISDMAVADQLYNFKKGLQPEVAREVAMQRPEDLDKAMHIAQLVDIEIRQAQRNYSRFHGQNGPAPRHYSGVSGNRRGFHPAVSGREQFRPTTVPMELGNTRVHSTYGRTSMNEGYDEENDNHDAYAAEPQSEDLLYASSKRQAHYVENVTREEAQRRISAGLCIRCKKPGHFARECPFNNKAATTSKPKNE